MKLDIWMSYWLNAHNATFGERSLQEGVNIWIMSHGSTRVVTHDVQSLLRQEAPHLAPIIDDMDFIRFHHIVLDPDALLADCTSEQQENYIRHIVDEHCVTDDGEGCVYSEFMEGKSLDRQEEILTKYDDATRQLLLDTFNDVVRVHDLSVLMRGDGAVMSAETTPGGSPRIEILMARGSIDKEVEKFREQLDNSSWGGG